MSRRANLPLLDKSLGRRVISDWRTSAELEAGYLVHLDDISSGLTGARGSRDPIRCITLPLTLIYQPQWRCQIPSSLSLLSFIAKEREDLSMRKGYDVVKEGRKEGTHPSATGPSLPPALVARWPDFNCFGNLPVGELASPAYGTIQVLIDFKATVEYRTFLSLHLSLSLNPQCSFIQPESGY